jgi:hypothetical protein
MSKRRRAENSNAQCAPIRTDACCSTILFTRNRSAFEEIDYFGFVLPKQKIVQLLV